MKTKSLLIICCILFSVFVANAQDTIYKRTKEVINAKITEIGLDEIKYKVAGYESGPTVVIAKDQVWKVVFANGITQMLQPEMFNPESYSEQRKNAIKVDFMAPMFEHMTFIYEHSIKPGQSYEVSVGIIGLGYHPPGSLDPSGAFVRFGYKFIKSPDYYVRGMKYAHILKGSYVRPDLVLGSYSQNNFSYDSYSNNYYYSSPKPIREQISYGALHLTFGKQWVFSDVFLIDYYVGLGYTFSGRKDNNIYDSGSIVRFGSLQFSNENPFSVSGGLRIGILFK